MVNLTLKDLLHEKGRFLLVVLGLTVSMMMVTFGMGFINGSLQANTRFNNTHPQYEAFITQSNRQNIFDGGQVHDSIYNRTDDYGCTGDVQQLIVSGIGFKYENEIVGCQLMGYDLLSDIGPWDILEGKEVKLFEKNNVIVDISIKRFIPDIEVGDKLETGFGDKVEVVGFCEDNTYWGNPFCWASYETALALEHIENENVSSIVAVEFRDGYDIEDLKEKLEDEDDINIHHIDDLLDRMESEVSDNLGSSIGMITLIGFFVCMIIISATMYSTVMEKIPQLVSMKALGAGQGFINRLLIGQVFIFITLAIVIATIASILLTPIVNTLTIYNLMVDPMGIVITFGVALNLGIVCSLASMRKVKKTDPAVIFRA